MSTRSLSTRDTSHATKASDESTASSTSPLMWVGSGTSRYRATLVPCGDQSCCPPISEWEEDDDVIWEDVEYLAHEMELLQWCNAFRGGNTELRLCSVCGRVTKAKISLDQWVFAPLICGHCISAL